MQRMPLIAGLVLFAVLISTAALAQNATLSGTVESMPIFTSRIAQRYDSRCV